MQNNDRKSGFDGKKFIIWMAALICGAVLGTLGCGWLNDLCDLVAKIYTRLFQFVAVPTIALAVTTTLATLGAKKNTGRIFLHTIIYTLLTTIAAAAVGAVLYMVISPGNLPAEIVNSGAGSVPGYSRVSPIFTSSVIRQSSKLSSRHQYAVNISSSDTEDTVYTPFSSVTV